MGVCANWIYFLNNLKRIPILNNNHNYNYLNSNKHGFKDLVAAEIVYVSRIKTTKLKKFVYAYFLNCEILMFRKIFGQKGLVGSEFLEEAD